MTFSMYLFGLVAIIVCFATTTVHALPTDGLVSGQLLRNTVCAHDEQLCLYYGTCCKLTDQHCSNKSKNCESILLSGETLPSVCCRALHNVTLLNRSGVRQGCRAKYGDNDFWPRNCTTAKAESTTAASSSNSLPRTDIIRSDEKRNGFNEPLKTSLPDNIQRPTVPAPVTAEGGAHNGDRLVYMVSIILSSITVVAVLAFGLLRLMKRKKRLCFTRTADNSKVENTAENNNLDNKQTEQTEMLASIGSSANELHRRQQGPFQAVLTEGGEIPGGPPAGPGSSEPNGGSINISEGEDVTTETTCLTGSSGRHVLE